ncbi:Tubby -like protein [Sarcoptes scabiei]|uniref:Tubby-like protein n=1 Tax=Sarcoptes scabiei TaxID=52283 RepID=A0A834RJE5_SARSC|nr:Tubby -like protein [Sarcoptes scabiei]
MSTSEHSNNRLSSAKWSRNLNNDVQSDANRLRLLERQRQLIESKLQRRQQQEHQRSNVVPSSSSPSLSSRPATSVANLRSGLVYRPRSNDLNDTTSIKLSNIDDLRKNPDEKSNALNETKSAVLMNRARTSIPSSRTISSLTESPKSKISDRNSSNNSFSNQNDCNQSNRSSTPSKSNPIKQIKDQNRSFSRSEANLSTFARNETELNKKVNTFSLSTPNPLTTVLSDDELLKFVSQPVSPEITLQCTIIRDKKGLDRSLYPTYYMHLQDIICNDIGPRASDFDKIYTRSSSNKINDGTAAVWMSESLESIDSNEGNEEQENKNLHNDPISNSDETLQQNGSNRKVFVLSGRRRKKSKTYIIGNNAFDISRDRCMAKLKSNVLGTQFTAIRLLPNGLRHEISSITYETNVLGFKGPRKMTIIIPKPDEKTNSLSNLTLQEEFKRNSRAIMVLKNKVPIWNEETQSYVLNFHGRVTQASVKNFQLIVQDSKQQNGKNLFDLRKSISSHQLNKRLSDHFFLDDDDDDDDQKDEEIDIDDYDHHNEHEKDLDDDDHGVYNNYDIDHRDRKSIPNKWNSHRDSSKLARKKNPLSRSGQLTASSSEDAKQIVDTNELVSLQFGRVSNTHFSCDVSWPLSLLQAFAIALSSFDSKLACE